MATWGEIAGLLQNLEAGQNRLADSNMRSAELSKDRQLASLQDEIAAKDRTSDMATNGFLGYLNSPFAEAKSAQRSAQSMAADQDAGAYNFIERLRRGWQAFRGE